MSHEEEMRRFDLFIGSSSGGHDQSRGNRPIYPVFWALFSFYPVFLKLA